MLAADGRPLGSQWFHVDRSGSVRSDASGVLHIRSAPPTPFTLRSFASPETPDVEGTVRRPATPSDTVEVRLEPPK